MLLFREKKSTAKAPLSVVNWGKLCACREMSQGDTSLSVAVSLSSTSAYLQVWALPLSMAYGRAEDKWRQHHQVQIRISYGHDDLISNNEGVWVDI